MKQTFNRIHFLLGVAGFFALISCATKTAPPEKFAGATPLQWSVRMADSEIARRGDSLVWQQGGKAKWDYTVGLFTLSLLKLDGQVQNPDYVKFAENTIGSFITPEGGIQRYKAEEYQLDAINPGKTVLALWQITHDERYQKAAALLRRQLDTQPRTADGGFWHKQRYPHQMWLDGLFMGAPFYAEYARLFNGPVSDFDDVAKQIRLVAAHTYDPATGLFYHAWDESKEQPWAIKATGTSSNFWGRAIGWYAMALVDVLDYFPASHPARPEIIATFQKLCSGVVKYQDPKTGLWYQVLDQGDRKGNYLEATASGMFVYAMAKGVNHGYLPRSYVPVIEKGYRGIIENLVKNDGDGKWSLTQCCSVAGLGGTPGNGHARDGSFDYYVSEPIVSNDLKGVGPFILAGIEMQQLLNPPPAGCGKTCGMAAGKKNKSVAVKVTNPAGFSRSNETVEINLQTVASDLQINPAVGKFAVRDCVVSNFLDSQVYASEPGQALDKLLFQVDLAPGETRTFCIVDASALTNVPPPTVRTFARYVPERMDDFAWESDRIAHRTYGQALIKGEGTITSGPDVWIKKNRGLIVDVMYATKHYHEDNGEFMDDYRVGKSRGCGGLGIWDGQKLYTSSNYRNWRLITAGPIRSEFELTYDSWDAGNGRKVSETKRYSIDAGSWFTKAQSTFSSETNSPLTIGVGLAERACGPDGEELIAQDQAEGWMSYWQPEDTPKGTIGVAIVLPKGSVEAFTNDVPDLPDAKLHAVVPQPTHEGFPAIRNLLAITTAEVGKPFPYYFGACWDRSGDFTNHVQWEDYVRRFAERRDAPLQVTIGK
ncbi:MAG: glycoside hydrolase family 88 protein [Verrucomicrobiota bacterium]|jgi:rhamnogalacturonyl hydrolase YesR